jgi:redox-sensitive bicupin YhaK (pirin superfamily)
MMASGKGDRSPMMQHRPAHDRGLAQFGWLTSRHSFSFGEYHDPAHMGFRSLRVINDDVITGGSGFDTHGHRDMEIITVVLEGAVAHKDSMGNTVTIRPGEVQRMSAGTGVMHSEYNASPEDHAHFLQIWLLPREKGIKPGYEQKMFDLSQTGLIHLASGKGTAGAIGINQDAELLRARLAPGQSAGYQLAKGRHAWLQVIQGPLVVNGQELKTGDGLAISFEEKLDLVAGERAADALLFDLA